MLNDQTRPRLKALTFIGPVLILFLLEACTSDVGLDPNSPTTVTTKDDDSPAISSVSASPGDSGTSTSSTIGSDNQRTTTVRPETTSIIAPDPGDSTGD